MTVLSSCGGGGQGAGGTGPASPTITAVAVTPASASVGAGATQQFTALVSGTGSYSSAVTWEVNGTVAGNASVGMIDSTGKYSAPSNLSAQTTFTVTAVSVEDARRSGQATATVAAGSPPVVLSISPPNSTIGPGQTQPFFAYPPSGGPLANAVWSVNGVQGGNASVGTIDSSGVYVAPTGITTNTNFTIAAASATNANETGSTRLTINPQDAITIGSITPGTGSVGDTLTITYADSNINGVPAAYFTGMGGSQIEAPTFAVTGGISVVVPSGAETGSVSLSALQLDGSKAVSNPAAFTRAPNILLSADRGAIASGESLQVLALELGSTAPVTAAWTTDKGSISGSGLFTAPIVTATTFVNVKGCFNATTSCDAIVIEVDPMRIVPEFPMVGLGQSLSLTAEVAGNPVTANWSVLAGGGSVASDGTFGAPNTLVSSGGVPIAASSASASQVATVAVTGKIPGLIARHGSYYDFSKLATPTSYAPFARYAGGVTALGNRAYAVYSKAIPETTKVGEYYIAVYDVSDIAAPKQIGAVEPPFWPTNLSHYGNFLIAENLGQLAIYNISSGMPVPVSYANLQPQISGNIALLSKRLVNGKEYGVPNVGNPMGAPAGTFTVVDLTTGTAVPKTYTATLPTVPGGYVLQAATGDGDHKVALIALGSGSESTFIVDISGPTPVVVDMTNDVGLAMTSDLLFTFSGIYDVSGSSGTLVKKIAINAVSDIEGENVLTQSVDGNMEEGRIDIFDVADSQNPTDAVTLYGGPSTWNALYNNYLVTGDDAEGVSLYDVSSPGGLHFQASNETSPANMIPNQQVVDGSYLYMAGTFALGGGAFEIRDTTTENSDAVGSLTQAAPINAIQASGGYAYIGDGSAVTVIDVHTPSSPSAVGTVAIATSSLALQGNALYDGTEDKKLTVINVSNPAAPALGASVTLPDVAIAMHVYGNRLYVADQSGGLLIFDITVPSAPAIVATFSKFTPVNDVAVDGNLALLAAGANGWVSVNVSNPAAPVLIAQAELDPLDSLFDAPGYATTVMIDNQVAYFGTLDQYCGVIGYDYTTPQYLRLVHKSDFSNFGSGGPITTLAASGGEVFAGCPFDVSDAPVIGWIAFDATQPRNVQSSVRWPSSLRYPATVPGSRLKGRIKRAYSVRNSDRKQGLSNLLGLRKFEAILSTR